MSVDDSDGSTRSPSATTLEFYEHLYQELTKNPEVTEPGVPDLHDNFHHTPTEITEIAESTTVSEAENTVTNINSEAKSIMLSEFDADNKQPQYRPGTAGDKITHDPSIMSPPDAVSTGNTTSITQERVTINSEIPNPPGTVGTSNKATRDPVSRARPATPTAALGEMPNPSLGSTLPEMLDIAAEALHGLSLIGFEMARDGFMESAKEFFCFEDAPTLFNRLDVEIRQAEHFTRAFGNRFHGEEMKIEDFSASKNLRPLIRKIKKTLNGAYAFRGIFIPEDAPPAITEVFLRMISIKLLMELGFDTSDALIDVVGRCQTAATPEEAEALLFEWLVMVGYVDKDESGFADELEGPCLIARDVFSYEEASAGQVPQGQAPVLNIYTLQMAQANIITEQAVVIQRLAAALARVNKEVTSLRNQRQRLETQLDSTRNELNSILREVTQVGINHAWDEAAIARAASDLDSMDGSDMDDSDAEYDEFDGSEDRSDIKDKESEVIMTVTKICKTSSNSPPALIEQRSHWIQGAINLVRSLILGGNSAPLRTGQCVSYSRHILSTYIVFYISFSTSSANAPSLRFHLLLAHFNAHFVHSRIIRHELEGGHIIKKRHLTNPQQRNIGTANWRLWFEAANERGTKLRQPVT
ncbi:hypothetical protein V490_00474 [Pseudogymnoascus sp. VKM F-3557]|nr:hypothetical protein V490_00474 [Pseudogymnoascus sp. VKM F-3557]